MDSLLSIFSKCTISKTDFFYSFLVKTRKSLLFEINLGNVIGLVGANIRLVIKNDMRQ